MTNPGDMPPLPPQDSSAASSRLTPEETDLLSAAFGLGVVNRCQAITRGAGTADKFALRSQRSDYLLKRRRYPSGDIEAAQALQRIRFRHALRQYLHAAGLPVEPYLRCRDTDSTVLVDHGCSYEVMRYVHGFEFDRSTQASRNAGATLAHLHRTLGTFPHHLTNRIITCHDSAPLEEWVQRLHMALSKGAPDGAEMRRLLDLVRAHYRKAAERVDQQEYGRWPLALIHGDWHPGNLIFKDQRVISILDFEATGLAPRAIDVACGALHFSIQAHGDDPRRWPAHPDELRWYAFCAGYDEFDTDHQLSTAEVRALPWLMIEALITEAVGALSVTGRVGIVPARHMLEILARKIGWLEQHAPRLIRVLE